MIMTNCLTAFGAIGCALFAWNPYVPTVLVICRFILGVGVGGKYPLSAMMRAEGVSANEHGPTEHAKNFFWQVPGAVAPYILALVLYIGFGSKTGSSNYDIVSIQIRILFALGAVPSLYVAWICRGIPESNEFTQTRDSNPLKAACRHPEYLYQLVGTGGSWFLYDFTIFGFFLNSPSILKEVFGDSEDITAICWQYLVISAGGLIGTVLSIPMATHLGLKAIQNIGFICMAASTLLLALAIKFAPDAHGRVFVHHDVQPRDQTNFLASRILCPASRFPLRHPLLGCGVVESRRRCIYLCSAHRSLSSKGARDILRFICCSGENRYVSHPVIDVVLLLVVVLVVLVLVLVLVVLVLVLVLVLLQVVVVVAMLLLLLVVVVVVLVQLPLIFSPSNTHSRNTGGFVGTYAFQPMTKEIGLSGVFVVCTVLSVLGVVTTHAFVKPYYAGFFHDARQRQSSISGKDRNSLQLPLIK
jgi:MFS family permease